MLASGLPFDIPTSRVLERQSLDILFISNLGSLIQPRLTEQLLCSRYYILFWVYSNVQDT